MNPQMFTPQNVLPADFDGTFRFTNWTPQDFTAKWGGKEYMFPALKTTPMVILSATPYEIQNIRKKFAKELAEREFGNGSKYKHLDSLNKGDGRSGGVSSMVGYNPSELESFVQRCLEPLPIATPTVSDVPKPVVELKAVKRLKSKLSQDNEDDQLVNGEIVG